MTGALMLKDTNGVWREARCDATGALLVAGGAGGGGGGGSSDTTEATQLAVKTAVQSLDAKTPAAGAAQPISAASLPLPAGAATAARQDAAATAFGVPADARAPWYDSAASLISLVKLSVAAFVGAGSRTYAYTGGVLTSEAWTLFGTTRTKTYTYTAGVLTGESDWV